MRRGVMEQMVSLISLGDGSTLTLDFTTGVLDPRLTFTRASTATFINSSGYVQFANANLMTYSNPRQTGTAWLTSGTVTWGSSTLTDPTGGSAAQSITFGTTTGAVFNTSGTTVVSGITHTFSVWMRSATGTTTVRIGDANVAPVATVTLTTTWQRFSCQYTTSGTNDGGAIFSQTGTPSAEFYVWGAQVQPGSIVGELIQTSGTINTNAPRFDHDPTTNAAKGLLIEGVATNLVAFSNGNTLGWGIGGNRTPTNNTTDLVSPDGTNNATKLVCGTALNYASFATLITGLTGGGTYTVSYWIRGPVGHTPRLYAVNGTVGDVTPTATTGTYTNTGWTRLTQTYTLPAATTQVFVYFMSVTIGVTGDTFYVYGFQLETGTTASTLIYTGTSTATREADFCLMTGANFSSWYQGGTQGTFYADWFGGVRPGASGSTNRTVLSTDDVSTKHLHLMQTAAAGNLRLRDFGGANQITTANTLTSGARTKGAFGYNGSSASVCLNGGTVATGSSLAFSVAPTWLVIGATSTNGTSLTDANVVLNNSIRQIKYWPTRLADGTLQGLTT
jgi:hypothetical protein